MVGKARLKEIAELALSAARADQTEVLINAQDAALTRFAANTIHQNVSETDISVRIRSITGKRVGVASSNDIREASILKLVQKAERIASYQQENQSIAPLPEPQAIPEVDAYAEPTAACSPARRAESVGMVLQASRDNELIASGALSTDVQETLIANSKGVLAYHCGTLADMMTVIMSDDSSGYGAGTAQNIDDLDTNAVGRIAMDKALKSKHPTAIDPGPYTVILEEDAVATMLFFLGYLGFSGLAVQEGRSFMSGHIGEKLAGDNITIWDDGMDPRTVAIPFDFEGVPKQKTLLMENGVARNAVYDSFTAAREPGRSSTGHALPLPNTTGPIPINLVMQSGELSKEELIASTERGIFVTRFHYVNPVHPVKAILTGMTRDGTFLIENGKIAKPLKNLRFTQSILDALSHATLSSQQTTVKLGFGNLAACVPAAKVEGFQFTGATEF